MIPLDPIDEVILRLEDQALKEAQLDDEVRVGEAEFFPLVDDSADGWVWLG